MSFVSPRQPGSGSSRSLGPVLPVGRRVFVHCPGDDGRRVGLVDDAGRDTAVRLPDGAEVDILAWRPRGGGGTRYRVRAMGGDEGWLGADDIRLGREPAAPAPVAPRPERISAAVSRKFGQR